MAQANAAAAPAPQTYARNALSRVILRVDLPEESPPQHEDAMALQATLAKAFPTFKEDALKAIQLTFSGTGAITTERNSKVYRYTDATDANTVVIEPMAVTFEWTKYESFKAFNAVVTTVLEQLSEGASKITTARAFSFRKINLLKGTSGNPFDFAGFVHPSLLACADASKEKATMARAVGMTEHFYDEGILRLRYGWFNSEFPNPISRKEFTLDYEAVSSGACPLIDVPKKCDVLNNKMNDLFAQNIGAKMREWLDGKDNL